MAKALAIGAMALLGAMVTEPPGARAGDALTMSGDVLEIALPLAAAGCAAYQHRLGSYATGFLAQTAVTQGLKAGFGDASINERPNGESHGFPSGHTAAAASGATDLAMHCAPGNRLVAAGMAAAVVLVGASRIAADEHTLLQVAAGAALGALSTGIGVYETPGGGIGFSYAIPF
jgi:membrane-associated phospholipid phosphatase